MWLQLCDCVHLLHWDFISGLREKGMWMTSPSWRSLVRRQKRGPSSQEAWWEEGTVSKTHPTALTKSSSPPRFNPAEKLTTYCEGHHRASREEEFKKIFTAGLVNLLPFLWCIYREGLKVSLFVFLQKCFVFWVFFKWQKQKVRIIVQK